jgi:hypothetical protein
LQLHIFLKYFYQNIWTTEATTDISVPQYMLTSLSKLNKNGN